MKLSFAFEIVANGLVLGSVGRIVSNTMQSADMSDLVTGSALGGLVLAYGFTDQGRGLMRDLKYSSFKQAAAGAALFVAAGSGGATLVEAAFKFRAARDQAEAVYDAAAYQHVFDALFD